MASVRTPQRRRQRSVRATVAVVLLSIASAGVALALPSQSFFWLSVASVTAVVLGWAALRIVWSEVLQSRRENARDRAAAASAYKNLYSVRAAEHAEFTSEMTDRLAESQKTNRELAGQLAATQRRAQRAEDQQIDDARALENANGRIQTLEEELALREADAVADLVEWDKKNLTQPAPAKAASSA